jgi:hypothetical protein
VGLVHILAILSVFVYITQLGIERLICIRAIEIKLLNFKMLSRYLLNKISLN